MQTTSVKETTRGIRIILYVASILVLSVGISLYLLSAQTETYFSWTINPPLTAAFLGAGYLASFLLEFLSARETIWARARTAVPAVWAFTTLTLIVTLLHLDRFHFNAPQFITVAGTWVWLVVYLSVPVAMGLLWIHQARQPGTEPPRIATLPVWLRTLLAGQGAIMLVLGIIMLLAPTSVIPSWPWQLSPLTCQAIGAWGVGIGIIALQAAWENDWLRLFPMMVSYAAYGTLQTINLLRFTSTIEWSSTAAIVYAIFIISILLVGIYGTWMAWSHKKAA